MTSELITVGMDKTRIAFGTGVCSNKTVFLAAFSCSSFISYTVKSLFICLSGLLLPQEFLTGNAGIFLSYPILLESGKNIKRRAGLLEFTHFVFLLCPGDSTVSCFCKRKRSAGLPLRAVKPLGGVLAPERL